jgi:methionyl-tRNA formyltransferase
VNLHGSLLPRYRGAAPIQWAIANGDAETGVCAMQLDEGLDTGPVYACEATPIGPDEDFQQLSVRLAGLGCALMKRTVEGILNGTIQPVPQDQTRATLAPILRKEDGSLDWNLPAQAIHNRIRAFNPWPGTRTTFRGESCRILKSRRRDRATDAGDAPATPGGVIVSRRGERFLAVTCGDGAWVELVEVQMPNRRPQAGMDFVNGFRVMTGEILGHPVEPVG